METALKQPDGEIDHRNGDSGLDPIVATIVGANHASKIYRPRDVTDAMALFIVNGVQRDARTVFDRLARDGCLRDEDLDEVAVAITRSNVSKNNGDVGDAYDRITPIMTMFGRDIDFGLMEMVAGVIHDHREALHRIIKEQEGMPLAEMVKQRCIEQLGRIFPPRLVKDLIDSEKITFDSTGDLIAMDLRQVRVTNIRDICEFEWLTSLKFSDLTLSTDEARYFFKLRDLGTLEIENALGSPQVIGDTIEALGRITSKLPKLTGKVKFGQYVL